MSQILLFRIEDKLMGIVAEHVRETVVLGNTVSLPGASSILNGLMTLRGRAIPVINLTHLLGHQVPDYELALILEYNDSIIALPVAGVIGYHQYDDQFEEDDIFNSIELNYEDVGMLSVQILIKLIISSLQAI